MRMKTDQNKKICWIGGCYYQLTHDEYLKDIEMFIGGASNEEFENFLKGKEYEPAQ
ncbi:MAG: hypothetical protein WCP19_12850 [Chloroflexota bacterium]